MARNHRKQNKRKHTFSNNQGNPPAASQGRPIAPASALGKGDSQPPRNITEASAETRIMLAYSARKNTAKAVPEYSTWKPATISDSPSATSKGARLVSATPAMKYTRNIGNSGMRFQPSKPHDVLCFMTIVARFKLPDIIRTHTSAKPMAISYDTICAAERSPPRNAYFEFDAQPATMTP